jgi:hypothetical protein
MEENNNTFNKTEPKRKTTKDVQDWYCTTEGPLDENWSTMSGKQQKQKFESQYKIIRDHIKIKVSTLEDFPLWRNLDPTFKKKIHQLAQYLIQATMPDYVINSILQDVLASKRGYIKNIPQRKNLNKKVSV